MLNSEPRETMPIVFSLMRNFLPPWEKQSIQFPRRNRAEREHLFSNELFPNVEACRQG
jgi:hypothetical protein